MPRYDFRCPCGVQERSVNVEDRDRQACGKGHNLQQVIDFRSIRFQVYAQHSPYGPEFTGPRQRARYLKDRGLIDCAGVSIDDANRQFANWKADAEASRRKSVDDALDGVLNELGSEVFTADKATPVRHHDPEAQIASAVTPEDL